MNKSSVDIYSIDICVEYKPFYVHNIWYVLQQHCRIEASLEETLLAFDRFHAVRLNISTK